MKRLICILVFVLPVVLYAQQNVFKSSPLSYMWMNVGNANFSLGEADYTGLAFSPSGEPYVAYKDYGSSQKVTVMKYNGTNWVNVGNAGFSSGEVSYTSLAFNPSGEPYVAYVDYGSSYKATVCLLYTSPSPRDGLLSRMPSSA